MKEPGRLQSMGSQRIGHLLSDFTFTFHFHALEKEMAAHSSVVAWRIPGTMEPGGLPSVGLQSRTRLKRLSSSSGSCFSDCVDHNKLWKILQEVGVPDHLTCLLRNLCAGQKQQLETDME